MLTVYAGNRRESLPSTSVLEALRAHLSSAGPGDYFSLLNYIEETPAIDAGLQSIRIYLRDATRARRRPDMVLVFCIRPASCTRVALTRASSFKYAPDEVDLADSR